MRYKLRLACVLLALFGFWPAEGMAGTVGKINGTVKDASGEPLPGANVLIKGTQRGATADAEGYFLILSVDPGAYELEASLVGYNAELLQNIAVRADLTTTVEFRLQEAAVELGELVVVAERPPVEVDKTVTRYVVGIEDIENVPLARSTAEVIMLQPGVSLDGNLRIRASRVGGRRGNNEVMVEIDGIRLANNDGLDNVTMSQVNSVARSAIQEVSVYNGGMNAEYGNAQGGVISLVSRENKDRYSGLGEYRLTLPGRKHWGSNVYDSPLLEGRADYSGIHSGKRTNYDEKLGHLFEANISGPITPNIGFFTSGTTSRRAPVYPNPTDSEPKNFNSSGNITYRPSGNIKFKAGGTWVYRDIFHDGGRDINTGFETSDTPAGGIRGIGQTGNNLFLSSNGAGKNSRTDQVVYGVFTHTLSSKTFYDIRISYQRTAQDTSDVPAATEDVTRDAQGFFVDRNIHAFQYARRNRVLLKADLSSQLHKGHFAKAGFEIIRYDIYQHEEIFETSRNREIRLVGKGDPIIGMEGFNPITYAAYIQDKMEFEGLVVNLGFRADLLDPGDSFGRAMDHPLWFHYNSLTRWRNVPIEDSPTQKAFSPRIGISHPITDRSFIRFFTGQFHQFFDMQNLYTRLFSASGADRDVDGDGVIEQNEIMNALTYPLAADFGNVNVKPEKTTQFEVGFEWNFAGPYVIALTSFYKDQEGRQGDSDNYVHDPFRGKNSAYDHGQWNRRFSTSRGFELSFSKKFKDMIAFNVAYNLNWAKSHSGGRRAQDWTYVATGEFVKSDLYFAGVTFDNTGQEFPRTPDAAERASLAALADDIARGYKKLADNKVPKFSGFWEQPVVIVPGLYAFNVGSYSIPSLDGGLDRRNFASIQLLFSSPPDYHIVPLAGLRATLIWQMQTGSPWNYSPPIGPAQRRNRPVTTVADVSAEKDFNIGETALATAFVEVRNFFGQRDDLSTGFRTIQYGLLLPPPGDGKFDQFGDIAELTRYNDGLGRPRSIVLGARFKF